MPAPDRLNNESLPTGGFVMGYAEHAISPFDLDLKKKVEEKAGQVEAVLTEDEKAELEAE
jgi:hypothetical protein